MCIRDSGTTVNSVKVSSTLLSDSDIISLGHHRLKVVNVPAGDAAMLPKTSLADTARMKSLDQMRRRSPTPLRVVPNARKA